MCSITNCFFLTPCGRYILFDEDNKQRILYKDYSDGSCESFNVLPEYEVRTPVYVGRDERLRMTVKINGVPKIMSFPKFILECKEGRRFKAHETTDHHDGIKTNNHLGNFKILSRSDNAKKYFTDNGITRKTVDVKCGVCGEVATKFLSYINHNKKQGKAGPFCSRSCAGKWSVKYATSPPRKAGSDVTIIKELRRLLESNPKYTKSKLAELLGIHRQTVNVYLSNLDKEKLPT